MNRDEIGGHRLPGLQASRQLDSLTSPERMTDSDDETLKRPQRGAQQWATSLPGVTQREALVVPQATQESLPSHPVHLSAHREQVADQHTHQMQDVEAVPARQESAPPPPDTPSPTRLRATSWFQRSKRVPVLHQVSVVECGAACLAMVLSYHGRKTSISEVHEHCGLGRDGLSARNLAEAARQYGLRVRAISLEENDFRFVPLPAIVHWQFNHFLVVERWSPKVVEVVDPAVGRKRLSAREFDEGFTGVVLMLEPGVHFQRENRPARLSLQTYVKSYLKQAPGAVVQVLGASLLLEVLGLVFPVLTAVVVDQLIPLKMLSALTLFGVGMILLVLAQLVVRLLRASVLLYVQAHVDLHMMLNFVEHLLSLPQRFFLERSSGDLLNRISSNVVIRDTVSQQLFSTLLDGSFVITYFLILLSQSLLFSSVVVVIGALQVILLLCTNQQIGELTSRELAAQGRSEGYLTEVLTGVRTLKAAGAEQRVMERWSNLFVDQMNISVRYSYVSSLIDTALSTLSICSPLVLLWLGTMQAITGAMQIGTMLALAALANAILMPLASFVLAVQQVQVVRSHLDRIADVVEAEPEQKLQAVSSPPRLRGEIRLDQVSFQYDPNSPMVLRDINAHIQPGQKVALVGRSGSGKSTLGNLLLGLYLPTRGQILYDGIPLQTLNYQQVRAQFGVVTQEASVFSGSIRENIALNDPSMEMEQVIRAAQLAALHDDILQMPMEYETLVSEGGNALSGGQRQRLAIARALAHAPAILLLDEATSNLDVITEQTVGQNLQQSCCTQIIIAHRLSTIRETDVILVLDQGTLVEQGSHQELLRRHGYYAHLIKNQLATGEIEGFEAAS